MSNEDIGRMGRMQAIFDQASALPWEQREAYLAESCGEDAELRAEIEEMLEAIDTNNQFLKDPTVHPQAAHAQLEDISEGMMIGPYRLIEKIGEGASANVYMVEQTEPVRRRLALKIIKLGMDTAEVIARFDAEKQALAIMDHPNIAKVFDAGATPSGRPYFVLELVKGIPITEYCDKNQLTTHERLELFLPVCQALQHAHLKGVIHRDLKPNNILVTLHDGVPVPKVIDFGIAKATETRLTDKTLYTKFHQFVGTPAYMSPEQAEMSGLDVDTRSDVYSLGVLAYELVTGSTPFKAKELLESGYDRIRKIIREEEPQTPSTRLSSLGNEGLSVIAKHRRLTPGMLNLQVRGDLDWVVMKALDKDRTRRYQSASELAADLRRYLNDEPVEAGPPNKLFALRKFVRRHRGPVMAASLVLLSLVAGVVLASAGWRRASSEAAIAHKEAQRADTVAQLLKGMFALDDPELNKGPGYTVKQLLEDFKHERREALTKEPAVEATVSEIMAEAYEGLGDHLEAERHWGRLVQLRAAEFGDPSPEVERIRVRQGWAIRWVGDPKRSVNMLESSVAYLESALGEVHADTLRARSFLVAVLSGGSEFSRAEKIARETLERYSLHHAASHPDRLWLLRVLSGIRLELGDTEEAEALAAQAVRSLERHHGSSNPLTLEAYHTLCQAQLEKGLVDEAAALIEQGLKRALDVHGIGHMTTLLLMRDQGEVQMARRDFEAAEETFARVLELQLEHVGENHLTTLDTHLLAVENLLRWEKLDQAKAMSEDVIALSQRVVGSDHAHTLRSIQASLQVFIDRENYGDVEPRIVESLETSRAALGADHPISVGFLLQLAAVRYGLDDGYGAQAHYEKALSYQRETLGDDAQASLETQYQIARCYYMNRRVLESLRLHEQVLEKRRALLGETHPDTLNSKGRVGEVLLRRGIFDRAEPILRDVWTEGASNGQFSPEQHHLYGKFLAEVFEKTYNYDRALETFREVWESAQEALGESHGLTQKLEMHWSANLHRQEKASLDFKEKVDALKKADDAVASVSTGRLLNLVRFAGIGHANVGQVAEAQALADRYREMSLASERYDMGVQLREGYLRAFSHRKAFNLPEAFEVLFAVWKRALEVGYEDSYVSVTGKRVCELAESVDRFPEVEAFLDRMADEDAEAGWPEDRTVILVERDAVWSYPFGITEEPANWALPGFAEENWKAGAAPLGFQLQQLGTLANSITPGRYKPTTYYFRHQFDVEDLGGLAKLKMRLRCDDGAVVYVNGEEVVRENLPQESVFKTRALRAKDGLELYQSNVYVIDPDCLQEGQNTLAVEVHQHEAMTYDLVFQLGLEALAEDAE